MATALFVMKSLDHIDHIDYIVPSSVVSLIIHGSSICTQLIWFSWSGWNEVIWNFNGFAIAWSQVDTIFTWWAVIGRPTIRKTTLWKCSWCRSWGTNLQQQKFQHHLDHIISMTISQTTASWPSFHARKWGYSFLADLLGASLNLSFLSKIFSQHIPRTYPNAPPTDNSWYWRNSWIIWWCLRMGYANQGYVGVLLDSWHWGHCKLLNA